MGVLAFISWILTAVAWILLGIWTFNWIGVDSFGTAIVWLVVWHVATAIVRLIFFGIMLWIGSNNE